MVSVNNLVGSHVPSNSALKQKRDEFTSDGPDGWAE